MPFWRMAPTTPAPSMAAAPVMELLSIPTPAPLPADASRIFSITEPSLPAREAIMSWVVLLPPGNLTDARDRLARCRSSAMLSIIFSSSSPKPAMRRAPLFWLMKVCS